MTAAVTAGFELVEAKIAPPIVRPGAIERSRLLARLDGARDAAVVNVVGGSGYGKTTLLAQWSAVDDRPFAWLTVDEFDQDPVRLLAHLVASLERAGLVDASRVTRGRLGGSPWHTVATRVCRIVSSIGTPFVIALDDIHTVPPGDSIDALGMTIPSLPPGSQVVLSGRHEVSELVVRRRAAGAAHDIVTSDLALTRDEARAMLAGGRVELTDEQADALFRHTEGWAAGLCLYAIVYATGEPVSTAPPDVDRSVEDYLWAEHLSAVSRKELAFLTRTSVLERMCAELCDAVLERSDSGRMLSRLERSNPFLVPLDHERRWYRYHELLRAALVKELERDDPGASADLRNRAADWCVTQGLAEEAMIYAVASCDTDRMSRTMVGSAFPLYRAGRSATLEKWLAHFDDAALLERYPDVAVLGAILHALYGRPFHAERWLDAADRSAETGSPPPDGSASMRAWIATGSALLCRSGVARMREDAECAIDGLDPVSPLRPAAMTMLAIALMLEGADDVRPLFEAAAEASHASGATFAGVVAYGELALLALARDDLASVDAWLTLARELVGGAHVEEYGPMALFVVAEARSAIKRGDAASAAGRLAAAHRLRPYLTYAMPYYAVQALVELAKAHLELGEVGAARAVLVDAAEVLRHRPELGILEDEYRRVYEGASSSKTAGSGWESSLTAAELRLLPFLTSHLTFREIGERLFISRNTVKTQAISIYRKLGVTSRSAAVAKAAELGLLESVVDDHAGTTLMV